VDLPISCLVVALAEFAGVLESAFMGKALDKHIDGLAKSAQSGLAIPPKKQNAL
jgi:hypothetical protein